MTRMDARHDTVRVNYNEYKTKRCLILEKINTSLDQTQVLISSGV